MEKSQAKDPDRIDHIEVRGARVHNLKNVSVDIPLGELVGVAGVSGSGKSSLALGVLYAEGSRRYLEALSTYTRRRISQAGKAAVDDVRYVPAALALHQRPAVPGVRSTFGTSSELLNSLRLLFSRVGSHVCPHCGAHVPPSLNVAAELPLTCPACGQKFRGPGAEELAFNSGGACPTCGGTGVARTVNRAALVPDESKSIDEGAVVVWGSLMWDLMKQVCGAMGVRTNVPFCELTPEERAIVFDGPAEKRHILYKAKKGDNFAELDFTYFNAVHTVENSLAKAKDEKGLKRVAKFLVEGPCPDCGGTRLSAAARGPLVRGINLAEATQMTLDEACAWMAGVPERLPAEMRPMAASICESFQSTARRLLELGLGYLSLDRAGSTLSTGERQRVQLARSVRNCTTGVLYVMDEPSIGLHPANVDGLLGVMRDLIADGNSVVMVDHDTRILAAADHLVEMGPAAGASGGTVVAQGGVDEVAACPESLIGPYLSGKKRVEARPRTVADDMFDLGCIHLESSGLHTVRPLCADVPKGRLVAVTGVSGSGKTTLVLETLVPALAAAAAGQISLDVQFLPDVDIDCPDCRASRYGAAAAGVRRAEKGADGLGLSLPELMALSVDEALPHMADLKRAREKLQTLHDLGLGYLTLGEATPALSGGEAQRLKLASEMGRGQADAVFVFDEPTIGLHPRDVETLLGVFQRLVDQGATVVVVEHDLDFIANADWVIDMGPGGGEAGGRVVACGTPERVAACPQSVTGRYLG